MYIYIYVACRMLTGFRVGNVLKGKGNRNQPGRQELGSQPLMVQTKNQLLRDLPNLSMKGRRPNHASPFGRKLFPNVACQLWLEGPKTRGVRPCSVQVMERNELSARGELSARAPGRPRRLATVPPCGSSRPGRPERVGHNTGNPPW